MQKSCQKFVRSWSLSYAGLGPIHRLMGRVLLQPFLITHSFTMNGKIDPFSVLINYFVFMNM